MADQGKTIINDRTYWVSTDAKGKPVVTDTAPTGGSAGTTIAGINTGIGATPAPGTQYRELTYDDGTKIVSRFDPTSGQWVQVSVDVDPQIRAKHKDEQPAGGARPQIRTFPDGSLRQEDPEAPDGWRILATKPQGPQLNQAPELVTLPDGSKATWNPTKSAWDIAFKAPEKAPAGLDAPASRPGQRTDLGAVYEAANQYRDALFQQYQAGSITRQQMDAAWNQYYETQVVPARARAQDEVNAEAARQQQRQTEADARARSAEDRAARVEERNAQTGVSRQRLEEEKFFYDTGQDAVKNAVSLLPYQHNPMFLEDFAKALNTVSSGGGPVSFRPEGFRIQLPDTTALAEAAAQRAAAHYAARSVPVAPVAGAAAAPTAPAAVPPEVAASLAAAPMLPRTMPGAGGAPVPRAPEPPIDPRLLQGAGGPGSLPAY